MKMIVVTVTNDLESNPQFKEDTENYPHLVEYIEDELETFVVAKEDGDFWPADEFFAMVDVRRFTIDE